MSAKASPVLPVEPAPGKGPATLALIVGLIGLGIGLKGLHYGIQTQDSRLGLSWLIGFGFWFAVLTGMLFLTQLSYLFNAGWSVVVRRQMENCLGAFKWLWLLLIPVIALPILLGEPGLVWKWMSPDAIVPGVHPTTVGNDTLYLEKAAYLNLPFMLGRLTIYALVMCGLAFLLRWNSFRNDERPNPKYWKRCRKISAIGIFLTAFCTTFAAFDLFMSLSYHWFSTMFGVWFFALSMRMGIAAIAVLCFYLSQKGRLKGIYNRSHAYFLGCLALAFTVFWAYISFSQYFLIYNANIPEETFWYNIREMHVDGTKNSWWYVSLALIFGYFVVPFIALLWYPTKVKPRRFRAISLWILSFGLLDLWFNIIPIQKPADNVLGFQVYPFLSAALFLDIAVLIGIGGIGIWAMLRSMAQHEIIPIHDPRILESIHSSE